MRRVLTSVGVVLALLVIGAIWQRAQGQATDSTICVAFRTRTAATGKVVSSSVAKVACGGAWRVDTVIVKVPGPAVHDTLPMVWAPNTNAARDSVLWYGPYAWPTNSRPTNFKLPLGPATHDTVRVIVIVHDTLPVSRPGAPELPRGMAAMDSMIASGRALMNQTVFADTLYQFHLPNGAWEWRCKGPGCATPAMKARLLTMKAVRR